MNFLVVFCPKVCRRIKILFFHWWRTTTLVCVVRTSRSWCRSCTPRPSGSPARSSALPSSAHRYKWFLSPSCRFKMRTKLLVVDAGPALPCVQTVEDIYLISIASKKHIFLSLRCFIRLDPFHFGQPDPGSRKSAKIMENFHKNQPKSYI